MLTGSDWLFIQRFPQPVKKIPEHLLWWPEPEWMTFLAQNIFVKTFDAFRSSLEKVLKKQLAEDTSSSIYHEDLPRRVAAGWISSVLRTYIATSFPKEIAKREITEFFSIDEATAEIDKLENEILSGASKIYAKLSLNKENENRRVFLPNDGRNGEIYMIDWLEKELPLLFTNLYVPMDADSAKRRKDEISKIMSATIDSDDKKAMSPERILLQAWQDNWPFIKQKVRNACPLPYRAGSGLADKSSKADFWDALDAFGPFFSTEGFLK